jgi:hypothetical protein
MQNRTDACTSRSVGHATDCWLALGVPGVLFVFVREVRLMIGMGTSLPRGFYDTFSHQFTDLDDVRLHHVDGPSGGETVVLLHGWPQTWHFGLHQQRDVAELLARTP